MNWGMPAVFGGIWFAEIGRGLNDVEGGATDSGRHAGSTLPKVAAGSKRS